MCNQVLDSSVRRDDYNFFSCKMIYMTLSVSDLFRLSSCIYLSSRFKSCTPQCSRLEGRGKGGTSVYVVLSECGGKSALNFWRLRFI